MSRPIIPIPRQNLADAVVNRLQQQISLGEYRPGEKLPPEPELMEKLGVGRSTIREAIRILANAGLVRVQQGSGTFVGTNTSIDEPLTQRLKRARAEEVDEVRQLLEMKIVEKAALSGTPEDIDKMKSLLARRHAAAIEGDIEASIQADVQFHVSIAEASKNDILADLYKTFSEQMTRYFREIHPDTRSFLATQEWHESLLDGIVNKDPEKAWHWAALIVRHPMQVLTGEVPEQRSSRNRRDKQG
ncbi:MAG: FadR/GntR family transcriptional regulator [Puia sp.]|nr:FadR/GntR family transcriptional regulator [Puia sp.]